MDYGDKCETHSFDLIKTGPVLKRVPKAAKFEADKTPTSCLRNVCSNISVNEWIALFYYLRICLGNPNDGRKKDKSLSKRQIFNFQILNWKNITIKAIRNQTIKVIRRKETKS